MDSPDGGVRQALTGRAAGSAGDGPAAASLPGSRLAFPDQLRIDIPSAPRAGTNAKRLRKLGDDPC